MRPAWMPMLTSAARRTAKLRARLREYAVLMRLDRPIGALLLLWPMLWALWIAAGGWPEPRILAIFLAGVLVMRSAGCVVNDFADRHFDPHVARTRDRPLAAGRVRPAEALAVFVTLGAVAVGLVSLTNRLTMELAAIGALLAMTYPYTKRYTYLPQVHLGFAFGWAVPMAFAAQSGEVPPLGWLVLVASILWTMVYDTVYAMVDRDDDIRIGVKSTAILFGELDRLFVGIFQVLVLVALAVIGTQAKLGPVFFVALTAGAALFGYQLYLIRNRSPRGCFRAFLNNNWFGAVIFVGIVADYAWK